MYFTSWCKLIRPIMADVFVNNKKCEALIISKFHVGEDSLWITRISIPLFTREYQIHIVYKSSETTSRNFSNKVSILYFGPRSSLFLAEFRYILLLFTVKKWPADRRDKIIPLKICWKYRRLRGAEGLHLYLPKR